MSEIVNEFSLSVEQVRDYEFRVKFDKEQYAEMTMDEPEPLGRDSAPDAARVLAAAIGNCLSASLLFCIRKARVVTGPIRTQVKVGIIRNENRRLRIGKVEVLIDPGIPESEKEKAARCLGLFEDFCTVSKSIRQGIDIAVSVKGFS
jgi:organic hydroperoxide reductase OsmC/OhrA